MNTSASTQTDPASPSVREAGSSRRARAAVLGLGAAVLAHLAATGWVAAVWDELPQRVVTHWGLAGPDGFTDRGDLRHLLALGLGISLLLGAGLVALMPRHGSGLGAAAGITAGTGVYLALMLGLSVVAQAGAIEPSGFRWWWVVVPALLAIPAGIGIGALVGRDARPDATTVPSPDQGLAGSELGRSWQGSTRVLGLWRWTIRIDAEAVTCRSSLGGRLRHEMREIEYAEVKQQVFAMEYGGPGLRLTREGERIVGRSGRGLRLVLSDGTDFIVTVDEAEPAARLVNTILRETRLHG